MNAFSNEKMKELVTLLQLLVTAMVGIDEKTGELNEKQLYGILHSISSVTDEERESNINGTLQEQLKALNDNLARTNELLDYIDDCIGHDADGTGYIRIMDNGNGWTWSYKESATQ